MSLFSNVLTQEDIEYLNILPEVLNAKARLSTNNIQYFKVSLKESIRTALVNKLGLNLSNVTEIPMRWIKGDTAPHVDKGASIFENTYLVYITNSEGSFTLEDTSYPITENTGFVFSEGLLHSTDGTGTIPRLLLGPMNEFAEPVGSPIIYYDNYEDAVTGNYEDAIFSQGDNLILRTVGKYTEWKIGYDFNGNSYSTAVFNSGFDLSTLGINYARVYPYRPAPVVPVPPVVPVVQVTTVYTNSVHNGSNNTPGLVFDPTGTNLYITDYRTSTIWKVVYATGVSSSFYSFNNGMNLWGITFDTNGNMYVGGNATGNIYKITSSGVQTLLGNVGGNAGELTMGSDGFLYVAGANRVTKISPTGTVTPITANFIDGSRTTFDNAASVRMGPDGNLYVLDCNNGRVVRMSTTGANAITFAGSTTGIIGSLDGTGTNARLNFPIGSCMDSSGNLYTCDVNGYYIRKVTPAGVVTTIAGTGVIGSTDGIVGSATLQAIGICIGPDGNLWFLNIPNSSVRKITLLSPLTAQTSNGYTAPTPPSIPIICFLEGTEILCKDGYVAIENLQCGNLVMTLNGYKAIVGIKKDTLVNPGTNERTVDRLYSYDDKLFVTGAHSILVDSLTEEQKEKTANHLGLVFTEDVEKLFVTESKCKLMAYIDDNAKPWASEGIYTIWHIALENSDESANYGIYANGYLVESCSIKSVLK